MGVDFYKKIKLKIEVEKDKIVIVNKQNKPQAVVISYERYIRLKEQEGVDI